jgi:hypothetical protein
VLAIRCTQARLFADVGAALFCRLSDEKTSPKRKAESLLRKMDEMQLIDESPKWVCDFTAADDNVTPPCFPLIKREQQRCATSASDVAQVRAWMPCRSDIKH